ncbi:hypothetical protein XELAEV_18031185mg [Xenopus laevis]|uniref:Protein kinase domain-containing protein n=1 Tax=Xenopus laevis TaxID=8355 RepID=A0A974CM91_XENLA|nr:hypothetical protein XELAEV_18031185mg [Xenopus laevis]
MCRKLKKRFKSIRNVFRPKNKEQELEEPIENKEEHMEEIKEETNKLVDQLVKVEDKDLNVSNTFEKETEKSSEAKVKSQKRRRWRAICKFFICGNKKHENKLEAKGIVEEPTIKIEDPFDNIVKGTDEKPDGVDGVQEQKKTEERKAKTPKGSTGKSQRRHRFCRAISKLFRCTKKESMKDSVPSPIQLSLEEPTENEALPEKQLESEVELKASVETQELPESIPKDTDEVFDHIKLIEEQIIEKPASSILEIEDENPPDAEGKDESVITTGVKYPSDPSISTVVRSTFDAKKSLSDPAQITSSPGAIFIIVQEAKKIIQEYSAEAAPAPSLAAACIVPVDEQEYRETEEKEDSDSKTPSVAAELSKSLTDDESDPINIDLIPGVKLIEVEEAKTSSECSIPEKTSEDSSASSYSTAKSLLLQQDVRHSLLEKKTPSESSVTVNTSEDSCILSFSSAKSWLLQQPEDHLVLLSQAPESSLIAAHPAQEEELAERRESDGACALQDHPDSADQQMTWSSLEDFDLHECIGKGSYGDVFLAEHKKTSKLVAIKRVSKAAVFSTLQMERLFEEKNILKMARDEKAPFLVGLVCSFQRTHNVYLAMEFCTGGDLTSQLKNGALPPNSTLFYSACIVLGIKFLHDRSIVHRDVKPANIIIDSSGYAKLADYGLCKSGIGYGKRMNIPCGTLHYVPPEVFKLKVYNRTVDWWALGVIIYQMAVGKLPFNGNQEQLHVEVVFVQPNYPDWLDENTNGIIRALLNKDYKERLGSAKDDGEQVMRHPYFEPMNWEALMERQLKPPFIPGPYVKTTATEGQKADDAATPPDGRWLMNSDRQKKFRDFDELPEAHLCRVETHY